MNIYIATELSVREKKIIKINLNKHNVYFSNQISQQKPNKNFLKCEIVFGNIPADWVQQSSKIKWLQLASTGFAEYSDIKRNFLNKKVMVTNLKGFFAAQVAQTVLAGIFCFYRGINLFPLLKKEKKWIGEPLRKKLEILNNKNILFLGKGSINREVAKYLEPFNCKYSFIDSRTKNNVFYNKLKLAEIIICALPGTKNTNMLFNVKVLNYLSKNSILINVGRGNLIDENHLIKKLKNKSIKGAILDVTDNEPLKKNDPLWTCPNLILTQHTGGGYMDETKDKVYFFIDNFKRYFNGKSPLNIINPSRGY